MSKTRMAMKRRGKNLKSPGGTCRPDQAARRTLLLVISFSLPVFFFFFAPTNLTSDQSVGFNAD